MEKGLVFGLSIGELLEIYDRDSQSWKMSGCLFTGDYAKSSGPLRKSGMMRNGKIYEQATWVPRTKGKESGLWPTPQVFDATCGDLKGKEYNGETRHAMKLIQAVKRLPTPHSNCHTGAGKRGDGGENLQTVVGGTLNPTWVDWLMGYPIGWTDLGDSETRLSLK